MHILLRIAEAAYATGTHHKLALDALHHLSCREPNLWRRLFFVHAKIYLEGSKAPDNEFKDFKNHVLHTRDGYWGGAPEKVQSWYHHVVEALAQKDWPTAVYCAGVLSHYYTDPFHPFHTGQSEAENSIHRACEWSIAKAYDELRHIGEQHFANVDFTLADDASWLVHLVCDGAARANGYYEKLIAHYDIHRGVTDPPSGLDRVSKGILAELIRYASVSFGAVLSRAVEESKVLAPDPPVAAALLQTFAYLPIGVLARKIADSRERSIVQRMYDELVATGTVEKHLPEDDRLVRDLYEQEILSQQTPPAQTAQVFPFGPREKVLTRVDKQRKAREAAEWLPPPTVVSLRTPELRPEEPLVRPESSTAPAPAPQNLKPAAPSASLSAQGESSSTEDGISPTVARMRPRDGLTNRLDRVTVATTTALAGSSTSDRPARASAPGEPRVYLTPDHDVVHAPSIGPKTAERLSQHGIKTVSDLLQSDPAALAESIGARNITRDTIGAWQDQARLVCAIPDLRGTHAQLLVGAGYRTADAIADAAPDQLCAAVLAFAGSTAGQRVLRNGDPPDIERIKGWLEAARSAKAA